MRSDPNYDPDDICDDSSIYDGVEIDGDDDNAERYLHNRKKEKDINEFIDEFYDVLEDEAVSELIDENGITGAGYALLADLDAQGAFI